MKLRVVLSLLLLLLLIPATSGIMESEYRTYVPLVTKAIEPRGVGAHRSYVTIGPISREQALRSLGVDWYYDWSVSPAVYDDIEAVPMIWDETVVESPLGGNSEWILTFNEFDSPSQADMTNTQVAQLLRRIEQLYPNRKIVFPVPTADDWGQRDRVLSEYRRLYGEDPRVSAVAAHIYPRTWNYFVQVADAACAFAERFGVKVWVTEYAYLPCWEGGTSQAAVMMGQMTAYFEDNQNKFERWAPFILSATGNEAWNFGYSCNPTLFSMETGQMTAIGLSYKVDVVQPTPTFTLEPTSTPVVYADPRADVNDDRFVNIFDIAIVGSNFGRPVR